MEEFLKRIEDLYNRARNRNVITCTNFLTPTEAELIRASYLGKSVVFSGGRDEAERVRAFFLPEYMEELEVEEYIKALRFKFSFKELSHRDFLGAILNLGIKRECLGDIYVFEKEAYAFVTLEVVEFIKLNLTKVGKIGVVIEEVEFDKVKMPELKLEEVKFSVQSLRLDSVASGIFNESREKMNLNIRDGIVMLNYLVCQNPSQSIKEGDIISIKGFGKAVILEIGGLTRRGKTFMVAGKYV